MIWIGATVAVGVNKGGEYISSKISDQNKPVEISSST